ncbi:MAG: DUF2007 domain-containing protein [Pseudomonadota bacterium]
MLRLLAFVGDDSGLRVKGWTRLYTADNPVDVGFIQGLLAADGLPTQVQGMELWAAAVEIYFAEGARPSVWVRDQDVDRARTVMAQSDRRDHGEPWDCPACQERLEGQFSACWRCARPS